MTDYTLEEREAIRQRAARALESCDATLARLAERDMANEDGTVLGSSRREAPQPPAPVPPIRRPPSVARSWADESRWINEHIDVKLAANNEMLAGSIGQASAEADNALQAKLRAETKAAIEGLRAEMKLELATAMTSLLAAVVGDGAKLDNRLQRLDQLLARWEDEDPAVKARGALARVVN